MNRSSKKSQQLRPGRKKNSRGVVVRVAFFLGLLLGSAQLTGLGLMIVAGQALKSGKTPAVIFISLGIFYLGLFLCWMILRNAPAEDRWNLKAWTTLAIGLFVGPFIAGFLWWGTGQIRLHNAKRNVKSAGLEVHLPDLRVASSSDNNAISWLVRTVEEPSWEAIAEEDSQGRTPRDLMNDFLDDWSMGKFDPEVAGVVSGWIQEYDRALILLDRAYECPRVDWGVTDPLSDDWVHKGMNKALDLGRLSACRAILTFKSGSPNQAWLELEKTFWLAETLGSARTIIGEVMSWPVRGYGLKAASGITSKASASHVNNTFRKWIRSSQIRARTHETLVNEILGSTWDIGSLSPAETLKLGWPKNVNTTEGKTTYSRYFVVMAFASYWPFLGHDGSSGIRRGLRIIRCFEKPFSEQKECVEEAENMFSDDTWLYSAIKLPRYGSIHRKGLIYLAGVRAAKLGWTAQKYYMEHNRWPLTIKSIAPMGSEEGGDPFTEDLLKMSVTTKGLQIYSVGPDQVDDGGREPYDRDTEVGDLAWLAVVPE